MFVGRTQMTSAESFAFYWTRIDCAHCCMLLLLLVEVTGVKAKANAKTGWLKMPGMKLTDMKLADKIYIYIYISFENVKNVYNKFYCSVGLFAHTKEMWNNVASYLFYFACESLRSVSRNHRPYNKRTEFRSFSAPPPRPAYEVSVICSKFTFYANS